MDEQEHDQEDHDVEPWKEHNWNGEEVTVSIPNPFSLPEAMMTEPTIDLLDLDRSIWRIQRDITRKIDAACVVAQEKNCGVKVTKYVGSGTMMIEVSDKVPAGEIYYYDEFGPEGEFEPL